MKKTTLILNQALERKKRKNASYSLGVLSQDLGLSRAFVSAVITGKKKIPSERLDDWMESLEMDEISQENLLAALMEDHLDETVQASSRFRRLERRQKSLRVNTLSNYEEVPAHKMNSLLPWYNIAIMDLVALKDFEPTIDFISSRLGLPRLEVEQSWNYLVENKFVEKKEGTWTKAHKKLRVPTRESHELIRKYHEKMILKGLQALNGPSTKEHFDRRLITGVTFTADSRHLKSVMNYLNEKQYEAADMAADGEPDEVYHLQLMLFPLTK